MNKCVIYNPYRNHTVTDKYVEFVEHCMNDCGISTRKVEQLEKADINTGAFVVSVNDAPTARKKGYSPVILWVQGISPEESYMRNKSKLRMAVLSMIERRGLLAADALLLVSDAMHDHYRKKYKKEFNTYYVMPCFNEEIDEKAFYTPGKYTDNVFLYAGGLQVWQCFDETMQLFAKIESRVKNCSLRVLTKDSEKAKEIITRAGVNKYSIGYVDPKDIESELSKAKFGFSLRADTPVNRVATPTKLSTYVAYGVMPIYSQVLLGFGTVAKRSPYCIGIGDNTDESINRIVELCNETASPKDIFESFEAAFGKYYSTNYHREHLSVFIRKLM